MFLDPYKILNESVMSEGCNREGCDDYDDIDELEKADTEQELMDELDDAEEVDDSTGDTVEEMVPVVAQESADFGTKYLIEAGYLFKYMRTKGLTDFAEAFDNIKKANAEEIVDEDTYLVINADELKAECVGEDALDLINALKNSGIKLLKEAKAKKDDEDEDEKDDDKDSDDDDDDKDSKDGKKKDDDSDDDNKKKKDDDSDDDSDDDDDDDKKSKDDDKDSDDDDKKKKDDDKKVDDELEDVEDVKEAVACTAGMVPVIEKTTDEGTKYYIEFYNLYKFMKANGIDTLSEAVQLVVEENQDTVNMDDTSVLIDPDDISPEKLKEAVELIREAKSKDVKMSVKDKFNMFRMDRIDGNIAKLQEKLANEKDSKRSADIKAKIAKLKDAKKKFKANIKH